MWPTGELWAQGKLDALTPKMRGGILFTSGRFSSTKMTELVGQPDLPILSSKTRLAELMAIKAHEEAHTRDISGLMARVSRQAWIIKPRGLLRRIIRSCMTCRLKATKVAQQVMGKLPDFSIKEGPPFTAVAVDLFGPLVTKGIGGFSQTV